MLAALLALLALATCSPFAGSMGGPPTTAATPTTTVPNPFACPRRASP
jgi:hypothetical protein